MGSCSEGGFMRGSLHELYGPPLSGKSRILQRTVSTFVHEMGRLRAINQRARADASDATQETITYDWDVYICLSSPELLSSVGVDADADSLSGWWSPLRRSGKPNKRTTDSSDDDTRYRDDHVHFVRITEPNDLLSFLAWLSQTSTAAKQGASRSVQVDTLPTFGAETGNKKVQVPALVDDLSLHNKPSCATSRRCREHEHHVLLVIDSLSLLWMHPVLRTQAFSHSTRWFAAELHRLLRICLRSVYHDVQGICCDGKEGANADVHSVRLMTAITSNSCTSYSNSSSANSSVYGGGQCIDNSAYPPRPHGEEGWWRAVDTRVFVEPANPFISALAAPLRINELCSESRNGSRTRPGLALARRSTSSSNSSEADTVDWPRKCGGTDLSDSGLVHYTVNKPHSRVTLVKGRRPMVSCTILAEAL